MARTHVPEVCRAIFAKSICANCHKIGDIGKTIRPALDGIGNRGLDRLLEDMLDPSRNVDMAFRTVTIETDGAKSSWGLGSREPKHVGFQRCEGSISSRAADGSARAASVDTLADALERDRANARHDYYSLMAHLLNLT